MYFKFTWNATALCLKKNGPSFSLADLEHQENLTAGQLT